MKIRVFSVNHNGKIEFTKAELERLLNEVYAEGQNDCNCGRITWTNPYITPYITCSDSTTTTTTSASTNGAPATATITLNSVDAQEMSKHINDIFGAAKTIANQPTDVYSKLSRELNF